MGRSDDMLIIRGVNVFPSQIEGVLMNTKGVAPHYQIIVDRINNKDTLEVQVEVAAHAFTDQISDLEALAKRISSDLLSALGIRANVKLGRAEEHREKRGQGGKSYRQTAFGLI